MQQGDGNRNLQNGRRIARNAVLLYLRMFLLMFIGLFTSRVVLRELGVEDYGVWNAVGGVVTMFTFITTSISSAISRYLAFEIGRSDSGRLRKVFATGMAVQLLLSLLLVLLVETAGAWFLNAKMVIPAPRMDAARFVLHCSLGVLVLNMLSVPFNAAIIAHERMSAFAWISIGEAALKLLVALLLSVSVFDKLETYALLMLAVALLVRVTYGIYCRRNFEESRARPVFDRRLFREMAGFAGWSFFGSGAGVLNVQGSSLLVNMFFGVAMNAARGVASQVEAVVKQFAVNFLTAVNPQITKSWASGDRGYCYSLVAKGSKFSYLAILLFTVPIVAEADYLLRLWLGNVPAGSAEFVRLSMAALLVDMGGNSLLTLQLATGKVRRYYLATGLGSLLCLPAVWLAFRLGAGAQWAYICLIGAYLLVFALRLYFVRRDAQFPVGRFLREVVLRLLALTVLVLLLPLAVRALLPEGALRLVLVCLLAWASTALAAFGFVLTPGERAFLLRKPQPWMPDRLYLELSYWKAFGRPLNLKNPVCYTEKLQWQKVYDRNPLYHVLADKAEVKSYVAGRIGAEHLVPTLGVWDSPEEIDWDGLPESFVLKCTHDSGSTVICRDKASFDRAAACRKLEAALRVNFYRRMREWVYKGLKPRIIAERFLEGEIRDYKFFCFDGVPRLMFVATDRFRSGEETKFDFFDMEWNHLDIRNGHPNAAVPPERPACFEEMKRLAAELSEGIPQVRVDFYEVGGKVLFGEYTFYHWGGFMPFEPDSADLMMGEMFKLPRR